MEFSFKRVYATMPEEQIARMYTGVGDGKIYFDASGSGNNTHCQAKRNRRALDRPRLVEEYCIQSTTRSN